MIRNLLKSVTIAAIRDNNKNFYRLLLTRSLSVHNVNFTKINVKTNFQNETIELYVDDSSSKPFEFPFLWLRDNCKVSERSAMSSPHNSRISLIYWTIFFFFMYFSFKCKRCFHESSNSRTLNWEHFDVSIKPKSVEVCLKASIRSRCVCWWKRKFYFFNWTSPNWKEIF